MTKTSSPPADRLPEEAVVSHGVPELYKESWDFDPETEDISLMVCKQGSERVLHALQRILYHFQEKAFDLALDNLSEPIRHQYHELYLITERLEYLYGTHSPRVAALVALNLPLRIRGLEDTLQEALRGAGFSSEGDVDVREIRASGSIATGNGSISLAGVNGDIVGNSGNGGAEATRYSGSLIMNVGNGPISISDADGSFDLNSGNGEISVTGASGSFDLTAGNGSVILLAELVEGSQNSLASGNGSITAEIEGTPNVFLDLETEEGNITTNVAVNVKEESERHLIGTIGEGSASLRIRTGKGNITIN